MPPRLLCLAAEDQVLVHASPQDREVAALQVRVAVAVQGLDRELAREPVVGGRREQRAEGRRVQVAEVAQAARVAVAGRAPAVEIEARRVDRLSAAGSRPSPRP